MDIEPIDLREHPVHLGLGATATAEPAFTGDMDWYAAYAERHSADGAEGRLVAVHEFGEDWDMWEVHPVGAEVVVCLSGVIVLHQETPEGEARSVTLGPGQYAINEPGVWHTADVPDRAAALFVTAGQDTGHRPR